MRHSFKERMFMKKETLTLKSKSTGDLIAPSTKTVSPTAIKAGKSPNKGNTKSPDAVARLIQSAIANNVYIFIQMRHGAGYRGLPSMLDDYWLILKDADIYGTNQNMHVAELLIQVKDGSYIAHIHTSETKDPSKNFDAFAGDLK
jgi:hypothetical protein